MRKLENASDDLGLSKSSIFRILKNNKFHPYKLIFVHRLQHEDYQPRLDHCNRMLLSIESDPQFLRHVLAGDEATFFCNGESSI